MCIFDATFAFFVCVLFSTINVFSKVILKLVFLEYLVFSCTDFLNSIPSQLYAEAPYSIHQYIDFFHEAIIKEKFPLPNVSLQARKVKIRRKWMTFTLGRKEKISFIQIKSFGKNSQPTQETSYQIKNELHILHVRSVYATHRSRE